MSTANIARLPGASRKAGSSLSFSGCWILTCLDNNRQLMILKAHEMPLSITPLEVTRSREPVIPIETERTAVEHAAGVDLGVSIQLVHSLEAHPGFTTRTALHLAVNFALLRVHERVGFEQVRGREGPGGAALKLALEVWAYHFLSCEG